ncbi:MAG: chemotaxis protein CheA [Ignavibacteriae bacterium]|nr:chemotaxis protein CheA [Ignavibacteriota bacterium]
MSTSSAQFDPEMAEILDSFLVETNEIMERLGQDLLKLEKTPEDNDLHNTIFRAVHTVKGTSSFLGFDQMTTLAHRAEDVLNKIRRHDLPVTRSLMDVLFAAYDLLKNLLQRIEARNDDPVDLTSTLQQLEAVNGGGEVAAAPPPASDPTPVSTEGTAPPTESSTPAPIESSTPEPVQEVKPAEKEQSPVAPVISSAKAESTIRVDVNRLDGLMNLVGELVLGRNRLSQIAEQVAERDENSPYSKDLAETSSQIDLITTELQMAVMKTRMVPVSKVFNKLPRLVRDLCKETGKDINLEMFGEDTELDKSIIEELNDPLVHILRNSSDHGVEPQEDRTRAGKSATGTIIVKAEHEGNHIVISVSDDGRGMDPEKLKLKAIEKGLITEAKARDMSKLEAFDLIFAPGFITAQKVTNVSGRGVGMDVVRTNISRLKGIIEIDSEIGRGTTIRLKLPLTLAIIQGLLGETAGEIYCIPLSSVIEVVRVKHHEISTIHGKEVIRLRNIVLPLARLSNVFDVRKGGEEADWIYVIVIGLAEQRLGIVVDSLIGQREVVIKSLGEYLGNISGVAGSTILGDGKVIMILDVAQFIHLHRMQEAA